MQARHRIFAVEASDQLRQVGVGGQLTQNAEQGRLFVGFLLVGGGQDLAHRKSCAVGRDDIEQADLATPSVPSASSSMVGG